MTPALRGLIASDCLLSAFCVPPDCFRLHLIASQVGCRALAVAVIGTAFPLLCGMALTQLFFPGRLYPDGFAAGCSLAPTSVGEIDSD